MIALAGGSGNIINPDGSLVLIAILFIVFVFLLNRILFKPIGAILDQRENLTEGARAEARAAARQHENRLDEYESRITQARAQSYRFLEQQRSSAIQERIRIIYEAKQRAAAELASAKEEISRQAAEAKGKLEGEARLISQQISRSLLGRTVGGSGD